MSGTARGDTISDVREKTGPSLRCLNAEPKAGEADLLKPPSRAPRRARVTKKPVLLVMAYCEMATTDQATI